MNMTNKVQEYSNDNSEIKSKYIAQDVESGERTETVKVTKEEVFDEIPTLVAFCMKLIGLLEPKNNCRRVSFTWFCRLICIVVFNWIFIPLQINEENATPFIATYTYQSIPYGLFICWLTASIHSLCYKLLMKGYINDLIFFWRVMLPADKQNLSKFIKRFALLIVIIMMVVIGLQIIGYSRSSSVFPQWYHYYYIFFRIVAYVLFLFWIVIMLVILFFCFIVTAIGQSRYIDQKGKEIQTLILKTKGRETSNSTMEKVTEICDNLYERMRISNKYLGNFMGKFFFLVIVLVIAVICDILNLALSSQTNNNTALLVRYGGRVLYYSPMIFGVMWTLLQPSLAWTKVINRIKRPNVLQILTTQYFGNGDTSQGYKCFIDIMKFQRERVVWNCFGISITENFLTFYFTQLILDSSTFFR